MKRKEIASQEQALPLLFAALLMQQSQVKTYEVAPTGADSHTATLAVGGAIKPTATPGNAAVDLLTNRPVPADDYKVIIQRSAKGAPPRVMLFPATASFAAILSSEVAVGTMVRDDTTKETSSHAFTADGSFTADDDLLAALNAVVDAQKPKRNLASLVNAIVDAHDSAAVLDAPLAICFDQTGDGTVTIYRSATVGSTTGIVGDVTLAETTPAASASVW